MKKNSIALFCSVALVLVGCAETPVELDPKNMNNVHRIAVVGPTDPVAVAVTTQREVDAQRAVQAASAVPFAGLLGAAVAGGVAGAISAEIARETSKPLNDEIKAEKYSYAVALEDSLVATLKADGYDVSTVPVEHKMGRFAEKLDGVDGKPDLIVDAVATASCTDIAAGAKRHFRPVVRVQVKLTRPGQEKPIMSKTFVYDDAVAAPDAFDIKGDPQYDIANYAALKANIKDCLNGIKASAIPLATAVASVAVAPKTVAAAN